MKRLSAILTVIVLSVLVLLSCAAAVPSKAVQDQQGDNGIASSNKLPGIQFGAERSAAPVAPPAPSAPDQVTSSLAQAPSAAASPPAQYSWDRMIIRNGSITLTVKDVGNSLNAVRDIATASGGWVSQSNSRYEGERQVANITIQVPAASFDSTISELRKLAIKVETETSTSQDVTEEYTDLDSQVRNLQATEAGLLKLMDRATRMEDILALQRELTNVRGQIEKLQGRMKFLKQRTEMSSISVSLIPEGALKPGDKPVWNPLATAQRAWSASAGFLQALADLAIAVLVFLWWVIPIAVIAWLLLRSRMRRRPTQSA